MLPVHEINQNQYAQSGNCYITLKSEKKIPKARMKLKTAQTTHTHNMTQTQAIQLKVITKQPKKMPVYEKLAIQNHV